MEKTWTCIATCQVCGAELNRAIGVPENRKFRVEMAAPMVAICDVRDHNSTPDLNFGVVLTWKEEHASPDGD